MELSNCIWYCLRGMNFVSFYLLDVGSHYADPRMLTWYVDYQERMFGYPSLTNDKLVY